MGDLLRSKNPATTSSPTAGIGSISTPCCPNRTVVEFRPKLGWKGEYGFDWLRIDDSDNGNSDADNHHTLADEKTYEDSIMASKTSGFNNVEAFEDLESEQYTHLGLRNNSATTGNTVLKYYIPYLNLYSKVASEEIAIDYQNKTGNELTYKPPYKATLRLVSFTEGDTKPIKVFITFPKDHLIINNNTTGKLEIPLDDNFIPNNPGKRANIVDGGNIYDLNIECIKDLDKDDEINVYAIYKINGKEREYLAGSLCVCQNDVSTRKTSKMVMVEVVLTTAVITNTAVSALDKVKELIQNGVNISGNFKSEAIIPAEEERFYHIFYQALIYPEVEKVKFDRKFDPKFHQSSDPNKSFISNDFKVYNNNAMGSIPKYLKDEFLKVGNNSTQYDRDSTFFGFFLPTEGEDGVLGLAEMDAGGVFQKSAVMFDASSNPETLSHEGLHGFGVYHAHNDGYTSSGNIPTNAKYLYVHAFHDETKATTNIMNYRNAEFCYSSWQWQWEILRRNA